MKKILLGAILSFSLISCGNTTTPSQDIEMLQKKYPKAVVFAITSVRYIIADTLHTYSVMLSRDGKIYSTVKIK